MKKVLVIEDNEHICELLVAILKDAYAVSVACDGRTGVASALKDMPDVILCDLAMPVMGGLEVIEQLRSRAETAQIPFVLMSGRGEVSSLPEHQSAGFLQKPFRPLEVYEVIDGALAKEQKKR